MGRVMRTLGGITGYRSRAAEQLAYIFPDMPQDAGRHLADAVLDHFGRVMIENYSVDELLARADSWPCGGPGWEAFTQARDAGRPILLITGHFGNHQAVRAALRRRGCAVGGLYRRLNNPYANAQYVASVEAFGGKTFPRDRRGLAGFMATLRKGGPDATLMMLIDQYAGNGELLDFLGKPAPTALSAAEIALKHDALMIPIYAERQENGLDFAVTLEAPIAHGDARQMTQALNDSLAARVRARPEQWFWVHRRWKPERQALFMAHRAVQDPEAED